MLAPVTRIGDQFFIPRRHHPSPPRFLSSQENNQERIKPMKKWQIFLTFIILIISLAGCSSGSPTVDATITVETPTVEAVMETTPTHESGFDFNTVPISEVQNIIWQWQSKVENDPPNQSIITNPQNYTFILLQDGTFFAQADCNNLQGAYSSDAEMLSLTLGITTLAECGPGSFYDQYLQYLQNVAAFGMQETNLVLQLADSAGILTFSNGGLYSSVPDRPCDAGIDPANVSLTTHTLPETTKAICVYEMPYNDTQPPGPSGLPDHIEILFSTEDPAQVQATDPILYIISVEKYTSLWNEAGNPAVEQEIERLRQLLLEKPQLLTTNVPVLPFERVTGTSDFQSNILYLDSQQATGIRFITRFTQNPVPVSRDNPPIFYVYQGLSLDGAYLVSFFYPVVIPSLPSSTEITQDEINQVESNPEAYLATKSEQLNTLQSTDFEPDLAVLDQVTQSLNWRTATPISEVSPIANINWQWAELNEAEPAAQTIISDPYAYTITFTPNGSIAVRADCNTATGSYTLNGPLITIQLGATTQAACPEGSQSTLFLTLLPQVNAFTVQGGRLVLSLQNEAGSMAFNNGGLSVVLPLPPQGVPVATAKDAINVRSGPGTQYPSFGVAPAGAQAEVIGKSEDGGWWVIRLPPGYSPDNTGWVSADFVETTNTDTVPVVPSPPAP
jgi:heat shock protein HslJ